MHIPTCFDAVFAIHFIFCIDKVLYPIAMATTFKKHDNYFANDESSVLEVGSPKGYKFTNTWVTNHDITFTYLYIQY